MTGDYLFNFYTSEWLRFEFKVTIIDKEEYGIWNVFMENLHESFLNNTYWIQQKLIYGNVSWKHHD